MVGASGNAPLVSFRPCLMTTGLQSVGRINTSLLQKPRMVAGPGNAPGRQGYEPRVGSSRPASVNGRNGRDGRARTCFLVRPRHAARLLRPHRVEKEIESGPGPSRGCGRGPTHRLLSSVDSKAALRHAISPSGTSCVRSLEVMAITASKKNGGAAG